MSKTHQEPNNNLVVDDVSAFLLAMNNMLSERVLSDIKSVGSPELEGMDESKGIFADSLRHAMKLKSITLSEDLGKGMFM